MSAVTTPAVGAQILPIGINDPGAIAGLSFDANDVAHGSLMQAQSAQ